MKQETMTHSGPSRSLRLVLPFAIGLAGCVATAPQASAAVPATFRHATTAAAPELARVTAVPVAAVAATTNPTLRNGAKGTAVKQLQQRLAALHYDVGGIDAKFGSDTLHAVYAFQKVQGLAVDGEVGPKTWAKLAAPIVPRAKYTISAAAVEVNLKARVVFLTRNGAVTKIIDASPGKPATPTVTGRFRITRQIDGWRESDLGLLYRPKYFYGGYAIHGANSVPTTAASHGCVRVTIAASNRLWKEITVGERVAVYR